MQVIHDLPGWLDELVHEEEAVSHETTPDVLYTEVLRIANIAQHAKRQVNAAIRRWPIKKQWSFFNGKERFERHTQFEGYAYDLAVQTIHITATQEHIAFLAHRFEVEMNWLLGEMKKPEWHDDAADLVILQETVAELDRLPNAAYFIKPKTGDEQSSDERSRW